MTLEEIEERHPRLVSTLASIRTSAGCSSAPRRTDALAIGAKRHLPRTRQGRGRGPARALLAERVGAPLRTDGFPHVADIMVGSFYDPDLDEGCAFEELISFHGGLGGPQTEAFVLHPARLAMPTSRSSAPPR